MPRRTNASSPAKPPPISPLAQQELPTPSTANPTERTASLNATELKKKALAKLFRNACGELEQVAATTDATISKHKLCAKFHPSASGETTECSAKSAVQHANESST